MKPTHARKILVTLAFLPTMLLTPLTSFGQPLQKWLVDGKDKETLTLVTSAFAKLWSKEQNVPVARMRISQAHVDPNDLKESQFPVLKTFIDLVDRQSLAGNMIHFKKDRRVESWFPYWAWVETHTGKVDFMLKPKDEFEKQRYITEVTKQIDNSGYTVPKTARLIAVAENSKFNFDTKTLFCTFGNNRRLHDFGEPRFGNSPGGNSFDNALYQARKGKEPLTVRPLGAGGRTTSIVIYSKDGKKNLTYANIKLSDGDAEFIINECQKQVLLFMEGAIEENPGTSAPFKILLENVRGISISTEKGKALELPADIIELK